MLGPVLRVDWREVERDLARYMDLAQRQPIEITEEGQPSIVMISMDAYERLMRQDRESAGSNEVTTP